MEHRCHAYGCETPCKPELFMCARHWKMVPGLLKAGIYATYRSGQCVDKRPSKAWIKNTMLALKAVKEKEALSFIDKD